MSYINNFSRIPQIQHIYFLFTSHFLHTSLIKSFSSPFFTLKHLMFTRNLCRLGFSAKAGIFQGSKLVQPTPRAFSTATRLLQAIQLMPSLAQTILPTDESQTDIEFDVTDSSVSKQKTKKVKNEKVVLWKMYGTFNRHNTHISLVAVVEDLNFLQNNPDLSYNEQVLYYLRLPHQQKVHVSAGQLGFRKAQRQEYEAGYQVTTRAFKLIQDKKLLSPTDKIELVLKNFGKGREAFLAALLGKEGNDIRPHIVRISDDTILKFGGTRSKKLRRL